MPRGLSWDQDPTTSTQISTQLDIQAKVLTLQTFRRELPTDWEQGHEN